MKRPIAISLSPNTEKDDIMLAIKTLFNPWRWKDSVIVRKLEEVFSKTLDGAPAFATNSGRSAEYIALKSIGVKKGDEVIIQAFTCVAVPNSILWLGATPVYADIDESYNIDPEDLRKKITKRTKAVIVQHTFGIPADIAKIKKVARGLPIIEDCAHALGAKANGKKIGTIGDIAFFSFGRDKVISSVFGGMLVVNNKKLYSDVKREVNRLTDPPLPWQLTQLVHPILFSIILPLYNLQAGKGILVFFQKIGVLSKPVYQVEKKAGRPGFFPATMPPVLAKLALAQLYKLERYNKHRQSIAKYYLRNLAGDLRLPPNKKGAIWLRFPLLQKNARSLYKFAKGKGVLLGDWYKELIAPSASLNPFLYKKGSCPRAEEYAGKIINLPTYPSLTLKDARRVVGIINKWQGT